MAETVARGHVYRSSFIHCKMNINWLIKCVAHDTGPEMRFSALVLTGTANKLQLAITRKATNLLKMMCCVTSYIKDRNPDPSANRNFHWGISVKHKTVAK